MDDSLERHYLNPYPHDPTPECQMYHCAWHHVDEAAEGFKVCGECLHTFETAAALWQCYIEMAPPGMPMAAKTIEDVYFCPLCAHDF
jgi:hypothetical protein